VCISQAGCCAHTSEIRSGYYERSWSHQESKKYAQTIRENFRSQFAVEQSSIHDFSAKKGVNYSPYFAPYLFGVEVDRSRKILYFISDTGRLCFDDSEIEEIKRRVLYMDYFEEYMNKNYFSKFDVANSFDPQKILHT
jgi:hypothetical protein